MLVFENKVKVNKVAFIEKVKQISTKLDINPNWLMYVMNFESAGTFSPSIRNPYSNGTGLIQFMPTTAISLGTNVDYLASLTNVQQLDWVYKYFKPRAAKYKSIHDLYLWTFYPYAQGKPDSYTIGSEKGNGYAKLIITQNPGLRVAGKDTINLGEWKDFLTKTINKQLPADINKHDFFLKQNI